MNKISYVYVRNMLLAVGLLGFLPANAAEQTPESRREITGFLQFRFGMTENEVRKLIKVSDTSQPGSNILTSAEPIRFYGYVIRNMDFSLTFFFEASGLNRIIAIAQYDMSTYPGGMKLNCGYAFYEVFGLIQAKYGRADYEPREKPVETGYEIASMFTAVDGKSIGVWGRVRDVKPTTCFLTVIYAASLEGNRF